MHARCTEYHERVLFSSVLVVGQRLILLDTRLAVKNSLDHQELGDQNPIKWQILALKKHPEAINVTSNAPRDFKYRIFDSSCTRLISWLMMKNWDQTPKKKF